MDDIQEKLTVLFGRYGRLSFAEDPLFVADKLTEFYSEMEYVLGALQEELESLRKQQNPDLTREAQTRENMEALAKTRKTLMGYFKPLIEKAEEAVERQKGSILRLSKPPQPDENNVAQTLALELQRAELRAYLLKMEMQERKDFVTEQFRNGNVLPLQSCIDSPMPIFPDKTIEALRIQYAFTVKPEMEKQLKQAEQFSEIARKRCGEFSGLSVAMIVNSGLGVSEDPLSRTEFFETFTPRTEMERHFAREVIAKEIAGRDREALRDKWQKDHPHVDLKTGDYIGEDGEVLKKDDVVHRLSEGREHEGRVKRGEADREPSQEGPAVALTPAGKLEKARRSQAQA